MSRKKNGRQSDGEKWKYGGGKSDKHRGLGSKKAAAQRYDRIDVKKAQSKPPSKGRGKRLRLLKKQKKHWQRQRDDSGEEHHRRFSS